MSTLNQSKKKDNKKVPVVEPEYARGHQIIELDKFGNFSPQWTIPSSRKEERPPPIYPSPGQYNPPRMACVPRGGSPISPRPIYSDRTVTSDIDMTTPRTYPYLKKRTIGSRKSTYFYDMTDGPPTLYKFKTTLDNRGRSIGKKHKERLADLPGPGDYNPRLKSVPKLTTISRSTDRELFQLATIKNPGPSDYHVQEPQSARPAWYGAIRPIKKYRYDDE